MLVPAIILLIQSVITSLLDTPDNRCGCQCDTICDVQGSGCLHLSGAGKEGAL